MPTTTLSSVGTSAPVNLNWRGGKPISALVTLASTTMTTDFTVQYTLDDIQLNVTPIWVAVSSATGSSATHFSSAQADASLLLTFIHPIAGLRISSTALSSSSLTLKTLQGEGW